jgi:hypothetical protein
MTRADLLIELGKLGKKLRSFEMADRLTRDEQDERDRLRGDMELIRDEYRRREREG